MRQLLHEHLREGQVADQRSDHGLGRVAHAEVVAGDSPGPRAARLAGDRADARLVHAPGLRQHAHGRVAFRREVEEGSDVGRQLVLDRAGAVGVDQRHESAPGLLHDCQVEVRLPAREVAVEQAAADPGAGRHVIQAHVLVPRGGEQLEPDLHELATACVGSEPAYC